MTDSTSNQFHESLSDSPKDSPTNSPASSPASSPSNSTTNLTQQQQASPFSSTQQSQVLSSGDTLKSSPNPGIGNSDPDTSSAHQTASEPELGLLTGYAGLSGVFDTLLGLVPPSVNTQAVDTVNGAYELDAPEPDGVETDSVEGDSTITQPQQTPGLSRKIQTLALDYHVDQEPLPTHDLSDPTSFAGRLHGLTANAVNRRWQEAQLLTDENAIISPQMSATKGTLLAKSNRIEKTPAFNHLNHSSTGDASSDSNQHGTEDSQGPRPWPLDPIPFCLQENDFAFLSEGLTQRIRLIDLVLADLLGPQELIQKGILPPGLIYANPNYSPAYQELYKTFHSRPETESSSKSGQILKNKSQKDFEKSPSGILSLYAADLSRGDDGKWWVTGDRTQAPSGLGFTLENRLVSARAHPDLFWPLQVTRLADFFISLQCMLTRADPQASHNPHVVLLSEGFDSPGKNVMAHRGFEDAFLARYLGYTLAESGDLAVRQGRLVLKTLGGAVPVDVLFRRINDKQCDPVELDAFSHLGVPGLLEVVRNRNVKLLNGLGCQLAESPAMMAFWPVLCQHILNEKLKLPSIATWWCGQTAERRFVIQNLDKLNIFPAFTSGADPIDARQLNDQQRHDLINEIKKNPEQYIGQERLRRSTTPVWDDGRLKPWHWSLRTFWIQTTQDDLDQTKTNNPPDLSTEKQRDQNQPDLQSQSNSSNHVMKPLPGGLVRVSPDPSLLDRSSHASVRVQDCWVQSNHQPASTTTLLPTQHALTEIRRIGAELPSRVADNLFWLGRSIETAEWSARLLRRVLVRTTGEMHLQTLPEVTVLVRHMVHQQQLDASLFEQKDTSSQLRPGFARHMVNQALAVNQLSSTLNQQLSVTPVFNFMAQVQECMRLLQLVRDRVSTDAWRLMRRLNRFMTQASNRPGGADVTDTESLLNHCVLELVAFGGLMSESMTRTLGWRFMDIGRRMQRAILTARLLQDACATPNEYETDALESILACCDSLMTYRARYRAASQPHAVFDLLVTDSINPRSILFQLNAIEQHVEQLTIQTQSLNRQDQGYSPLFAHLQPTTAESDSQTDLQRQIIRDLTLTVATSDPIELSQTIEGQQRILLNDLLDSVQQQLPMFSQALSSHYLIHAGINEQFAQMRPHPTSHSSFTN